MTRVALTLAVVAIVTAACRPDLDLSRSPEVVFVTNEFEVGETYTYGAASVQGPATISAVEVLESRGVEVLEIGAFDPEVAGVGLGLVPEWPPKDPDVEIHDALDVEWPGIVQIAIGVRTTEPVSGLRGILVRWRDAAGEEVTEVFDVAVVTCAPSACDEAGEEPDEWALEELGLVDP